jgi:hypothetical protein
MHTHRNVIRSLAICAALALVLSAPSASASRYDDSGGSRWDRSANGNLVDVQVLVGGQAAPLYFAPGRWDRRYFQALRGRNYALRVHNRTDRRVGVLISVDGLNVVNGERSNLRRNESMYVLDPWETATIRGWRTSLDQVRQFVFVDEERSYAERTGQANGDMGWIRVLAFEERRTVAWFGQPGLQRPIGEVRGGRADGDLRERESLDAKPQANEAPLLGADRVQKNEVNAPRSAEKLLAEGRAAAPQTDAYPGTGWGERRQDPVRETSFVAAATEGDHLVFRYEYASSLRALGIALDGDRLRNRERGELGFAKPPKW